MDCCICLQCTILSRFLLVCHIKDEQQLNQISDCHLYQLLRSVLRQIGCFDQNNVKTKKSNLPTFLKAIMTKRKRKATAKTEI